MKFDPEQTVAVIQAPHHQVNFALIEWLHWIGIPAERIKRNTAICRNLENVYNIAVKYYALHTNAEQFIFADNDIGPHTKKSAPFLELETDIACCEYEGELGMAATWPEPDTFQCGLFRCHRGVLLTMRRPWFAWNPYDDGCNSVDPGVHFRQRAKEAGFTISHAGWAYHTPRRKVEVKHGH